MIGLNFHPEFMKMWTGFWTCSNGTIKKQLFCLGWVARKYPEIIKKIAESGNEIATHSDLHQLAYQQNRHVFAEDLKRSMESLEAITGKKIRAYRAPGFSLMESNKWVFSELIKQGIEIDCSIFPAKERMEVLRTSANKNLVGLI